MSIETFERPLLQPQRIDAVTMALLAAMTEDKLCPHGRPKNLCAEHEDRWPTRDAAAAEEDG